MTSQPQARFQVLDAASRLIGEMVLEHREDKLFIGEFTPGSAFSNVAHLFQQFEEAVNLQALGKVDELDAAIRALGLYLRSPDGSQRFALLDVQIWSDRNMTCRLVDPVDIGANGSLDRPPRQPVHEQ
jgi:hypothetical protein